MKKELRQNQDKKLQQKLKIQLPKEIFLLVD